MHDSKWDFGDQYYSIVLTVWSPAISSTLKILWPPWVLCAENKSRQIWFATMTFLCTWLSYGSRSQHPSYIIRQITFTASYHLSQLLITNEVPDINEFTLFSTYTVLIDFLISTNAFIYRSKSKHLEIDKIWNSLFAKTSHAQGMDYIWIAMHAMP